MSRALMVSASPGTGKSTQFARAAAKHRTRARIVTGTKALAAELADEHGYNLIEGRNQQNCERHEVVQALGSRGYEVEALACGSLEKPLCPARATCPYFAQFNADGPRVGAAEQLFNTHFLAGGTLVVVDDADLSRTLVERMTFSAEELANTHKLLSKRRKPLRDLLIVLAQAILNVRDNDAEDYASVDGASAWDALAHAARMRGFSIEALVAALPKRPALPLPEPDSDGAISKAAVEKAPPAGLAKLIRVLHEELAAFETGENFNSRLRIGPFGIELWRLKDHIRGRYGEPLIADMDLLVLDATPVPRLVDHLTQHHDRLPDVSVEARMPENLSVVQYAGSTNGHAVLAGEDRRAQVLAEIAAERKKHPAARPEDEGAVCFKGMRDAMVEAGFLASQVLTYGTVRGTNGLKGGIL